MPFSCGRSLRAPASKATSTVSARVPGSAMRWIGRPLPATVVVWMLAIALTTISADAAASDAVRARHELQNHLHAGVLFGAPAVPRYPPRPCEATDTDRRAAGGSSRGRALCAARRERCERQRRGAHARPRRAAPPARDDRDTVVEFRGVSKLYGPGGIGLERATFAVRRQEMVFLVGPTGSGKSTIMRLLIKELEPTDGRIRVAGRDLIGHRAQEGALLPAQRRRGLPGLQAAADAHGVRQHRLRAAGHGRLAQADPRDAAGHPAPDRASRRSCTTTPTSSPAASSSASPSRARSPATRRCCWPTSRPATSTRRRRSGSCSCCTASTAPARR